MRGTSFRFVHDEDQITTKTFWLLGYRHIQAECYIDRDGSLHMEGIPWAKIVSWSTSVNIRSTPQSFRTHTQNPGGVLDHGMDRYVAAIENLIKT
jgi:hypothetical protein